MTEIFAIIKTFRNIGDAQVIKSLLESEGIECWLDNANMVSLNWLYSDLLGGIKLRVKTEDAKKALEIIKDTEEDINSSYNLVQTKDDEYKNRKLVLYIIVISMLLLGLIFGI